MAHLAILTQSSPCTTFATTGLNFRVRDGIGCFPSAIDTPKLNYYFCLFAAAAASLKTAMCICTHLVFRLRLSCNQTKLINQLQQVNHQYKNFKDRFMNFNTHKTGQEKKRIRMTREKSRRQFSIGQLNPLLNLHLRPINLVVFKVP